MRCFGNFRSGVETLFGSALKSEPMRKPVQRRDEYVNALQRWQIYRRDSNEVLKPWHLLISVNGSERIL